MFQYGHNNCSSVRVDSHSCECMSCRPGPCDIESRLARSTQPASSQSGGYLIENALNRVVGQFSKIGSDGDGQGKIGELGYGNVFVPSALPPSIPPA